MPLYTPSNTHVSIPLAEIDSHDERWMREAVELARTAGARGEVPVGAVIVKDGQVVGQGMNLRETDLCALRHAEILAIEAASKKLGAWRLSGCTLYVTLEPCLMCAGAIYQARFDRVVFGALDPKAGAMGSLYRVHEDGRLNHRVMVKEGVLAPASTELLQGFFRERRKKSDDS